MKITLYKIIICLFVTIVVHSSIFAQEYLSTGEVSAISGGSIGITYISHHVRRMDSLRTPLINGPILFDKSIQKLIGGKFEPGACNFLDNKFGSVITPVSSGVLLVLANLAYPQADKSKGVMQDLFLFSSGLLATKGVTGLSKGLFTRPRPYRHFSSDKKITNGFLTDRSSFFSGHTSGAFFSAAYLNLRMRHVMRSEMGVNDYNSWKWAPSTVLFSWASFVGFSRIHAYKHYFSDIVLGAVTGYLIAELFYSLNKKEVMTTSQSGNTLFVFRLKFNL